MMLVKTRVAPSAIHGQGLFAVEFIARGTPVWRYEAGFDRSISPTEFAALPSLAQTHVQWFGYVDREDGHYILSGDHTCFMNHSAAPNTGAPMNAAKPVTTAALRDIAAGEELTCNYFDFDAAAAQKLGSAAT